MLAALLKLHLNICISTQAVTAHDMDMIVYKTNATINHLWSITHPLCLETSLLLTAHTGTKPAVGINWYYSCLSLCSAVSRSNHIYMYVPCNSLNLQDICW